MDSKEIFKKKLLQKGWNVKYISWTPISMGRDGREGGWEIELSDEWHEDIDAEMVRVGHIIFTDGVFMGNTIIGYNKPAILEVISKMPNFKAATQ